MKKAIIAAVLAATVLVPLAAETGAEIMKAVEKARDAKSSAMEIDMTLIDKSGSTGKRTLQTLVAKADGLTRTVTLFLEPVSVKNTRFLTIENKNRDNDQWIYLPALRKIKRIAASERSGTFMGSDFSYGDMGQLSGSIEDAEHTVLREEDERGTACWVVESVPKKASSDYGKTVSWVSKKDPVALKVEFYSRDRSTLVKTLTSENIDETAGRRVPRKMTMTTLANGHKTVIDITKIKYDIPIKESYFTEYYLETGRAK